MALSFEEVLRRCMDIASGRRPARTPAEQRFLKLHVGARQPVSDWDRRWIEFRFQNLSHRQEYQPERWRKIDGEWRFFARRRTSPEPRCSPQSNTGSAMPEAVEKRAEERVAADRARIPEKRFIAPVSTTDRSLAKKYGIADWDPS